MSVLDTDMGLIDSDTGTPSDDAGRDADTDDASPGADAALAKNLGNSADMGHPDVRAGSSCSAGAQPGQALPALLLVGLLGLVVSRRRLR